MNDRRGVFITVEGSDGAGKSTQIAAIRDFFKKRGMKVVTTREPGGTTIGEKLRNILIDPANGEMCDETEMLIYAAARAQHVKEKIIPALETDCVVISDRFTDSSIAYQGYGRELGGIVADINMAATGGLEPDLTFWLDIEPASGRDRIGEDRELDRIERENDIFHLRVREGYETLALNHSDRIIRIDASQPKEDVTANIICYLEKF